MIIYNKTFDFSGKRTFFELDGGSFFIVKTKNTNCRGILIERTPLRKILEFSREYIQLIFGR